MNKFLKTFGMLIAVAVLAVAARAALTDASVDSGASTVNTFASYEGAK